MQYQSQFSESEPSPARQTHAGSGDGDLRDPFGRTLEVARDQDRARYVVRRRSFVRRLAHSATLYDHLYNGIMGVGLAGAFGGLVLPLIGFLLWGCEMPTTSMIFWYAAALGIFVCALESGARSITQFTVNWIRRMAEAEGITLDTPPEAWHTARSKRSRALRVSSRLRK